MSVAPPIGSMIAGPNVSLAAQLQISSKRAETTPSSLSSDKECAQLSTIDMLLKVGVKRGRARQATQCIHPDWPCDFGVWHIQAFSLIARRNTMGRSTRSTTATARTTQSHDTAFRSLQHRFARRAVRPPAPTIVPWGVFRPVRYKGAQTLQPQVESLMVEPVLQDDDLWLHDLHGDEIFGSRRVRLVSGDDGERGRPTPFSIVAMGRRAQGSQRRRRAKAARIQGLARRVVLLVRAVRAVVARSWARLVLTFIYLFPDAVRRKSRREKRCTTYFAFRVARLDGGISDELVFEVHGHDPRDSLHHQQANEPNVSDNTVKTADMHLLGNKLGDKGESNAELAGLATKVKRARIFDPEL
ncbi:hypothetical protein DFH11DRAFT_1548927 [Phellopilus nigrolimitatus]|nr:hypothetical protein DFH11DRAFT_1548927 [Phellopilus nigrolimitatus]